VRWIALRLGAVRYEVRSRKEPVFRKEREKKKKKRSFTLPRAKELDSHLSKVLRIRCYHGIVQVAELSGVNVTPPLGSYDCSHFAGSSEVLPAVHGSFGFRSRKGQAPD
jgi:hypothetical protein